MKRIATFSVLVIVALAATCYLSAKAGYNAALEDAQGHYASGEAVYVVAVMDRIRSGDNTMALSMLEAQLDSQLMFRWVYDRRTARVISMLRPDENSAIPELMGVAAQYRAQHPSTHEGENVRGAIAEVVKRYEPFAPKQQASPNNALERERGQ